MPSRPEPPDLPRRRVLPHGIPSWASQDSIFFVTCCCRPRGENQLCTPIASGKIFESFEFRQRRYDWFMHLAVLMPDHLHALVSFPRDREMKKVVSQWKEIIAKNTGVKWQRDFFDYRLRREESYDEKAHYLRMNPVRKGLAERPDAWPYQWQPT